MADDPRPCANILNAAGFAQRLPRVCTHGTCKNFFLAQIISGSFILPVASYYREQSRVLLKQTGWITTAHWCECLSIVLLQFGCS